MSATFQGMSWATFIDAYVPLPPSITFNAQLLQTFLPDNPQQVLQLGKFIRSKNVAAGLAAALGSAGLTVAGVPPSAAAQLKDGVEQGIVSGWQVSPPPNNPPLPGDLSVWMFDGFAMATQDIEVAGSTGPIVCSAGTLVKISESCALLDARQNVTPQLRPGTGQPGNDGDSNTIQEGTGEETKTITIPGTYGFVLEPIEVFGQPAGFLAVARCIPG